jgi:predicted nucleic acid-binding protein
MRIVCDTNILLRAFVTPGGSAAELLATIASEHVLVMSPYLLAELLEVLRRPKIRALHGLDEQGIRRIISRVYKLSAMITHPVARMCFAHWIDTFMNKPLSTFVHYTECAL